VQPEETFIARQRLAKHVPAATNTQATTDVLLRTMFSIRSVQSGYKRREPRFGSAVCSRVLLGRLRRDGDSVQLTE
jgi:hypothetical protein